MTTGYRLGRSLVRRQTFIWAASVLLLWGGGLGHAMAQAIAPPVEAEPIDPSIYRPAPPRAATTQGEIGRFGRRQNAAELSNRAGIKAVGRLERRIESRIATRIETRIERDQLLRPRDSVREKKADKPVARRR